ncbi:MAG: hypothetical protein SGILL_006944 [Bacillariaceae sp.]
MMPTSFRSAASAPAASAPAATNLDKSKHQTTSNEVSYTVLYYKRKNKVHKSKGVSKMDGTLTIRPPPKSVAVLKTDTANVIFQSGVSTELAKKGSSLQLINETIALGGYEVEILAVDGQNLAPMTTATEAKSTLYKRSDTPRPPLRGSSSGTALLGSSKIQGKKRSFLDRRIPQPQRQRNPQVQQPVKRSKIVATPKDAQADALVEIAPRPRKTLPAFQRPRKVGQSSTSSALLGRKRTAPPLVASSSIGKESTDFFPGAIGKLIVPYSIRKELKPHQIGGVTFLWNALTGNSNVTQVSPHCDVDDGGRVAHKGCILSDEMGLGKTLMTITTICALHKEKRDRRFVVVCPSSLVKNWAREFDKWVGIAGQPKRIIVQGGAQGVAQMKAFNVLKPNSHSEVLIISYDLFRMNVELLEHIKKVALLVVDEGHRLKNTNGSLTMTALESMPCQSRLCITATPIQNNLSDMYSIVNFVCPGVLGDLSTFRKEYERPIAALNNRSCTSAQTQRGIEASRTLDQILKCIMLRRLQKDVLEKYLPPRQEYLLFCRPSSEQCKLYKQMTVQYRGIGSSYQGPSSEALTALMGLRKVCFHPHLFGENKSSFATNMSGKLMVLESLLQEIRRIEPTDKVVIVSNFTATLNVIEETILGAADMAFLRLDGSTASSDRQTLVDTFNRTSAATNFALTLSSKAGGVGLNLIGSNRLILVDPDWNPSTDIQAMARIYRQGQKKACFIYRLFTSGTVEEVIYQRQMKKGGLSALTVDNCESSKGKVSNSLSAEELRDCFTLKESCICDTKNKVGDWPDYSGVNSLVSLNCSDKVLLAVASQNNPETAALAFVHSVNKATGKVSKSAIESIPVGDESDASGEESEFFG